MAKLSKIQIIAKHYSRCIIVDIENIMLVYYESAVQGKGAWGGGSLSGHKNYMKYK